MKRSLSFRLGVTLISISLIMYISTSIFLISTPTILVMGPGSSALEILYIKGYDIVYYDNPYYTLYDNSFLRSQVKYVFVYSLPDDPVLQEFLRKILFSNLNIKIFVEKNLFEQNKDFFQDFINVYIIENDYITVAEVELLINLENISGSWISSPLVPLIWLVSMLVGAGILIVSFLLHKTDAYEQPSNINELKIKKK
ncbi:MAG: hypothetical protein QXO71_09750 [Candidatus Jordarchaeaceae archaeon]